MQTQKRRRRIERMKKVIRVLLFIKHNLKRGVILIGCLMVLLFAGYFSIRYAEAAEEEKISGTLQMADTEQINLLNVDEEAVQSEDVLSDNSVSIEYPDADVTDEAVGESIETSGEIEKYATSHKSEEPVKISDIYTEEDSIAIFKSFYPDASGYTWEIFDVESQNWVKIPDSDIVSGSDELQRDISSFIAAAPENNNELIIRCTTDFATKESVTDTASLHVLDKNITDIAVDGDITVESGQYVSVSDIPIEVTYQDGSKETLRGLNGIYFLDTEQSAKESTVSGNLIETITTINKTYEYTCADMEDKEMTIRYRNADNPVDAAFHLIGEDLSAPIISRLSISEFAVSNVDTAIPVTVTIQAEDDSTPYADLEYAFLPDGKEPEVNDWHKEPSFDIDITQNGRWIAYCKDASGNIATKDTDIIAVDNKAPYVSLRLDMEAETWCQKNKIVVTADDALPVEYFYSCAETGEDSGWIKESEKEVVSNGTWKVKVRDEAGNIAETEIIVSNIDNHPPIISEIKEKEL